MGIFGISLLLGKQKNYFFLLHSVKFAQFDGNSKVSRLALQFTGLFDKKFWWCHPVVTNYICRHFEIFTT